MGLWARLRAFAVEEKSGAVTGPDMLLRELLAGGTSKAGQAVNLRTALEVSAVLACARVISEGLAQVPLKVYQKTPDGGRKEASKHALYDLLHNQPNDWQTGFELREQIGIHLALSGNAYVFKSLSSTGEVLELYAFDPGTVTVTQSNLELSYLVRLPDGRQQPVPRANIWHLRGPSWNGYLGLDCVHQARNAIGLALATEEFGSSLFKNGARPGGIITTDQVLGEDAQKRLKEAWQEAQSGSGNAMKTALLGGGLKFQQLSQTADEAQFVETRKQQVVEICRHMRVEPIMIYHNENQAAYASVEQRYMAQYRGAGAAWFKRVEDSASVALLSKAERQTGYYIKHDANALLRGTTAERSQFYALMLQNGVISRNEVRAWEDWDPIADPAFDKPLVAANLYGPDKAPPPKD